MRKTKIICTLGPATDRGDVLEQLIKEGMNVARFNFHMETMRSSGEGLKNSAASEKSVVSR